MERRLKQLLTTPFIFLAALVLWFWEWLWEPLERLMAQIGRLPLLHRLEQRIAAAPRYLALACFLIPGAALLPFKIAGLYFLAHGQAGLGILTILAAKVVGTALVARIFALTKPRLMEIAWFARAFAAVVRFRDFVFDTLRRHPVYQRTHAALLAIRSATRRVRRGITYHLWSRWRAVYRLSKRRGRLTCF